MPLNPTRRGLLALEHDLADLAVLALLGVVGGGIDVLEPEAAVLGLLGDRINVFGAALTAPVVGDPLDLLVADERGVDPLDRVGVGLEQHIALAQQLLGALLAEAG